MSVCLSVCHTRACIVSKRLNNIIKIVSLSDRLIVLVFRHQGLSHKSDGVTPNGVAEYKGVAIFDQYATIYLGNGNRGVFITTEDEYKVVCALSNSAAFDDLE